MYCYEGYRWYLELKEKTNKKIDKMQQNFQQLWPQRIAKMLTTVNFTMTKVKEHYIEKQSFTSGN